MTSIEPLVIENDVWQVGILPPTGMSTAFGRIKHKGAWVDFMRPTPKESYGRASDCASFILVPWSNRIKGGLFRFRGKDHQLKPNAADGPPFTAPPATSPGRWSAPIRGGWWARSTRARTRV